MRKKKVSLKALILLKFLLIGIFVAGFFYSKNEFSNTIPLLAVNELENGETRGGSLINLTLTTKPGTGQIFIDLSNVKEIDTQISIINSQEIACNLFELKCSNYDFYYNFEGESFVLKGPSASSAIGILVAKTVQKEKLNNKITLTGSLNSGGLIGNVGGVDEKILVAQNNNLDKILIPVFSTYDKNKSFKIEVSPVIDIIEVYNEFSDKDFTLSQDQINKESYNKLMEDLAIKMCDRSQNIYSQIDTTNITNQSSLFPYLNQREKSLNSSIIASQTKNFYSAGSFCYNANINSRIALEIQKNYSLEEIDNSINTLQREIEYTKVLINSQEYKNKIQTLNDFYVYILLQDRTQEALNYIKEVKPEKTFEQIIGLDTNQTEKNKTNEQINKEIREKTLAYSYAIERLHTVKLWEEFITNQGNQIFFEEKTIENACNIITRQITIKNELLKSYNLNIFEKEIEDQRKYSLNEQYLCIYNGLKLDGRINTILNTVGIQSNQSDEFTQKIISIANNRLSHNTQGHFPLIPYIYYEYAEQLLSQQDTQSAMLYANYAISYQELNRILKKEQKEMIGFEEFLNQIYNNIIFLISALVLISFIAVNTKSKKTKKINISTNSQPAKHEKNNKKAQDKVDEIITKKNQNKEEHRKEIKEEEKEKNKQEEKN